MTTAFEFVCAYMAGVFTVIGIAGVLALRFRRKMRHALRPRQPASATTINSPIKLRP